MTLDDYKRWLEQQIAIVGPMLEKLMNARQVIEMAERELGGPRPLDLPAEDEHPPRGFAQQRKPHARGYSSKPYGRPELWRRFLAEIPGLVAEQPMTSGELIQHFYPDGFTDLKRDKDRVYAACNYLKSRDVIGQDSGRRWYSIAAIPEMKEQANG